MAKLQPHDDLAGHQSEYPTVSNLQVCESASRNRALMEAHAALASEIPEWQPNYTITPEIARGPMRIEGARSEVDRTPLPPAAVEELRRRARIRSTHYSTRIEGNRLTLEEAEAVISGGSIDARGRERDVREVRNYWNAFMRIEEWAAKRTPITADLIRRLHALVETGPRSKPTPYRDGQNVIRDSRTGAISYLPPVANDVPSMLDQMLAWYETAERDLLPAPLAAGLIHYQLVTIHPYFDGNGRTARLLATLVLHRSGYSLNGMFSLEEYHAADLDSYYTALASHPHHNYYEGRASADLTKWLEYFVATLARVFTIAAEEARSASDQGMNEPEPLRRLDVRTRRIIGLFATNETITTAQVAALLGVSARSGRDVLHKFSRESVIEVADTSNRGRTYRLSAVYRRFNGELSAVSPERAR